jgi:aspartate beta-hydroxylase
VANLYDLTSGTLRSFYDRRVTAPPVLDCDRHFPEHAKFAGYWHRIREECVQLMRDMDAVPHFHDLMPEQRPLSEHGKKYWRLFVLKAYGVDHPANQAKCPFTASLLESKSIVSATLSFLEGHKHIPAHRGPFRGVLRYHLGLVIPRNADGSSTNRLRIDGKPYELKEGGELLWDDTYLHEAWNDADTVRACLLMDVARRDLPPMLDWINRVILRMVGMWIRVRYRREWTREPRGYAENSV